MKTAKVFMTGRSQAVRLPKEFRFDVTELAIWRKGDTVMLRPIKRAAWPKGFWESVRISDPAFKRHPQGDVQVRRPLGGERGGRGE